MFDLDKLIRESIKALKPYSSARDEFSGKEGVFLDANENPFGMLNRYPDPNQTELKSILSTQKRLPNNQVFVGNGSDEIIDLLFRIFCNPSKDKALTFSPTYGMYDVSAAINDIELIKLLLTDSFDIDLANTKEILAKESIKLTFICSPNNPTGNAFRRETIEEILKSSHGIVVIDEAYIDFSESNSFIDLIDTYPNLVIMQTMSKARGLASARVGFAFSNERVIELLNKVKPPYNVSGLNQQAAINTLIETDLFEKNIKRIRSQRKELEKNLLQLESVLKIYPSQANFLLVEFDNANEIYEALINQKIIVRNRSKIIENCIRITVGTAIENDKLLNELKQIEYEKGIIYRS